MKVFKFLSFYLIDFKLYIQCSVCIKLVIKLWPVAGFRVHKFAHLKEKKLIFLLAIVKKESSCRIEVTLYEFLTIKYQKFSIKIILTEVNHKFYLFNTFFCPAITSQTYIYIILYMNYKFWEIFAWLTQDKEKKIKKIWSKVNHNFYLFTYVILVHLLIKIHSSSLVPLS